VLKVNFINKWLWVVVGASGIFGAGLGFLISAILSSVYFLWSCAFVYIFLGVFVLVITFPFCKDFFYSSGMTERIKNKEDNRQ
jgi:hypothetical protein